MANSNIILLTIVSLCVSLATAHHPSYAKRNLDTITKIYARTVYPTNLEFIQRGPASVPPGLFAANARGRVTPLGNFTGFEDSTEYFFALAPVPTPPAYVAISKAEITHFSSQCPEVAASVVYLRTSVFHPGAPNDGKYSSTLKQVAFWRFDEKGAVLDYDAWIPTLRLWANATSAGFPQPTNPQFIQGLCGQIQQLCTGSNTQYKSVGDCSNVLSAKKFGDLDNIWQDSVTCRSIHVLLARVRPVAHCPHVGPTGGGKCVDEPYNEGYFDDLQLFGEPSGGTFTCQGNDKKKYSL